jgi:hypothetical protein
MFPQSNRTSRTVGCAAHNLQLAFKYVLVLETEIECILYTVSKLVTLSKTSNLVADDLKDLHVTLRKDFVVRWNSTYIMLKSYSKLTQMQIKSLLTHKSTKAKNASDQKKMLLDSNETEKLAELCKILQHLYEFTQIIQGDDVTISKILPSLATITARLEDALTDTELFGELICNLIDNIKSKFQYVYNNDLFIFASCLDPNFTFQWINAAEKNGIK